MKYLMVILLFVIICRALAYNSDERIIEILTKMEGMTT